MSDSPASNFGNSFADVPSSSASHSSTSVRPSAVMR